MSCPDLNELVQLAHGLLPPAEVKRLEAHLSGCDSCRKVAAGLLSTPGDGLGSTDEHEATLTPGQLKPGMRVNRYVVKKRIGRGGMGVVLAAHDPTLDRMVAIKLLAGLDEDAVMRFEREQKATAQIEHPCLVPLYEVGRWGEYPYIVMKLVEGVDLRRHIDSKGGKLTVKQALPIFRDLCGVLGFIHKKGFVHRDLKPANILIGPDGHVTLLDLGVARHTKNEVTKTGVVIGTLLYMSPEQLTTPKVDHRADLHALGLMLYEALCGQHPYERPSVGEVMRAIVKDTPPKPTQLVPSMTRHLEEVLLTALEKDPQRRYQSAAELWRALELATSDHYSNTVLEPDKGAVTKPPEMAATLLDPPKFDRSKADETTQTQLSRPRAKTGTGTMGCLELKTYLDDKEGSALVELDGERRFSPFTVYLSPGEHRVRVMRPGYGTISQVAKIASGEVTKLSLRLRTK